MKFNSSRNKSHHLRQLAVQNSYSQNQSTNYGFHDNIKTENNSFIGGGPSKNGYQNNEVFNQYPRVMKEKSSQFNAMMFESYDKLTGEQSDEKNQEDFLFPFNKEEGH